MDNKEENYKIKKTYKLNSFIHMYIRPLIFDRDVVGSKKLQRELCVRFGGEAKKSVFIGDKNSSSSRRRVKSQNLRRYIHRLLMFDPDVGGGGSIRRGDNTVINLKRFLMISVSSIKRIIQKIQILKMFLMY
jgi:hypothetical protein